MLDAISILLLALISAQVTYGRMNGRKMWQWINAYWIILTIKNFCNFIAAVGR